MIALLMMFLSIISEFQACDTVWAGPIRIENGDTYLICKSKPLVNRPGIGYRIYPRPIWDYTYRYGEGKDSVEYMLSTKRRRDITKMYEIVDSVIVPMVYIVIDGKKWRLGSVMWPAWHEEVK